MFGRGQSNVLSLFVVAVAMFGMLAMANNSWGKDKQTADPFAGAEAPAPSRTKSQAKEKLSAEERIERALDQRTSFEFDETALAEVVSFFSSTHKIPILLDRRALADEGLDPETPITFALKNVSLRSALNLM